MRMPDGSSGFRGSNGIMFLFTVIPAASSACSACLPVTPFAVTSTSIRWLSVPPETMRESGPRQFLGQHLRVGDHLRRVLLEGGLQRLAERDRLRRDDVHQRPALHAGEHGRVDLLAPTPPCTG